MRKHSVEVKFKVDVFADNPGIAMLNTASRLRRILLKHDPKLLGALHNMTAAAIEVDDQPLNKP